MKHHKLEIDYRLSDKRLGKITSAKGLEFVVARASTELLYMIYKDTDRVLRQLQARDPKEEDIATRSGREKYVADCLQDWLERQLDFLGLTFENMWHMHVSCIEMPDMFYIFLRASDSIPKVQPA